MIKACITNLGVYNEGRLIFEWLSLPCTRDEFAAVLKHIGIGPLYEEWFISDYDIDIDGIYGILSEYENIDALNMLAAKIDGLEEWELDVFESAIESGEHCSDISELIELCDGLDNFILLENVDDDDDLGRYYVEDLGCFDLKSMGTLANYIDYDSYGRDIRLESGGIHTAHGYIEMIDSSFVPFDVGGIPEEYKLI